MQSGLGYRVSARHLLRGILLRPQLRCEPALQIFHRVSSKRLLTHEANVVHSIADPRLQDFGPVLKNQFANVREQYAAPKHPIILAHGLFGFDELHIAGPKLPGISYWRGIVEALQAKGIDVYTTDVPASESIERRAERLVQQIETKAKGRKVNIIAHSMGGLDSRFMISKLQPSNFEVVSLTSIATPHRGSSFADYVFKQIGGFRLPRIYRALEHFGVSTGAFSQLTQSYMRESFNPSVKDVSGVRYFSYGAAFQKPPPFFSLFRQSYFHVLKDEGPNDGLVSIESSRWGDYMGTLSGVSHLDLINWTNRLRWFLWQITGNESNFNAIAFYLHISDMLAKEGL